VQLAANTEARRKQLVVIIADIRTAASQADVVLDEAADLTMPPAASKLTPMMTYAKLLVEQQVLGGMVGEQQVWLQFI
jgi:hypothetical protein